jgi:hypothetical protein
MIKRIKFTGKFKDLPPMGYKFQKLYARNYRCYHDYEVGSGIEHPFWIWQKERRFEIDDWHGLEVPIVEYCQTHTLIPRTVKAGKFSFTVDYFNLLCNRKTLEVREKVFETDDASKFFFMEERGEITKEQSTALLKEHYATYREIVVNPVELLERLKRFEGMYEIVVDEWRTKHMEAL